MIQNKTITIGVTGGSGCGKTTVCNILKNNGAYIIDADKIGHQIIQKGEKAYFDLIDAFGIEILDKDKQINRKKLGQIVFNNKEKLKILNNITHKHIIKTIKYNLNLLKQQNVYKYIVIDAALLIQTNLHKQVDIVWVIDSPLNLRIKRLKKRDNLPEDLIIKRIQGQMAFEDLKHYADFVLTNDEKTDLEKVVTKQLKIM